MDAEGKARMVEKVRKKALERWAQMDEASREEWLAKQRAGMRRHWQGLTPAEKSARAKKAAKTRNALKEKGKKHDCQ